MCVSVCVCMSVSVCLLHQGTQADQSCSAAALRGPCLCSSWPRSWGAGRPWQPVCCPEPDPGSSQDVSSPETKREPQELLFNYLLLLPRGPQPPRASEGFSQPGCGWTSLAYRWARAQVSPEPPDEVAASDAGTVAGAGGSLVCVSVRPIRANPLKSLEDPAASCVQRMGTFIRLPAAASFQNLAGTFQTAAAKQILMNSLRKNFKVSPAG